MQAQYKNIIAAWLNDSKDHPEKKYLSVKNVSGEDVVIKAGESLFLNMTPKEYREKNDKIPLFTKSVKIEQDVVSGDQLKGDDVADNVPF